MAFRTASAGLCGSPSRTATAAASSSIGVSAATTAATGPQRAVISLALPAALELRQPRPWAFSLLAIHEYMRQFYGDRPAQTAREVLAERLLDLYHRHSSPDWPWFEDVVSYSNAKLPHALLLCGRWMMRGEMTEAGLRALSWLASSAQKRDTSSPSATAASTGAARNVPASTSSRSRQ